MLYDAILLDQVGCVDCQHDIPFLDVATIEDAGPFHPTPCSQWNAQLHCFDPIPMHVLHFSVSQCHIYEHKSSTLTLGEEQCLLVYPSFHSIHTSQPLVLLL
jgi:hypothetical protein